MYLWRTIMPDIKKSNNKPIQPIVNRKQKRIAEKAFKSKGKSKEELNAMIDVINKMNMLKDVENLPKLKECLLEGDKIKLNVAKIKSHPSWEGYQKEYKDFVENSDDAIFTVEYDEKRKDKPNMVCLKEDTSRQKWLFWDGDLFVLDEKDGKFKELYMIEEGVVTDK